MDARRRLGGPRVLVGPAQEVARAGFGALDPDESPATVRIGPLLPSKEGCTNLCHVGVEATKISQAHGLPFQRATHVQRAGLDCASRHRAEPHGTVTVRHADCVSCHEGLDEGHSRAAIEQACDGCHEDDAVPPSYAAWIESALEPLRELEPLILKAPPETARRVRREIGALMRAGPHHNVTYAKAVAKRLRAELGGR